jgi:hypothetical protein
MIDCDPDYQAPVGDHLLIEGWPVQASVEGAMDLEQLPACLVVGNLRDGGQGGCAFGNYIFPVEDGVRPENLPFATESEA